MNDTPDFDFFLMAYDPVTEELAAAIQVHGATGDDLRSVLNLSEGDNMCDAYPVSRQALVAIVERWIKDADSPQTSFANFDCFIEARTPSITE